VEFRQLRYFVQIANDRTYTTAAKNLFITQPALSWTIKQLEDELGAKLFIADGKRLTLTTEGEELLKHANFLLAQHEKVVEFFQSRKKNLSGHIRLGIPTLFGTCFFMNTLMHFMKEYPQIKVSMHNAGSMAIQEMVDTDKVDLGIVSYLFPSNTIDAIELPNFSYPNVLIVSKNHPLAAKPSVAFADLKDEFFILLGEGYTVGSIPIQACLNAGFKPNVAFTSTDWDVICEAVANSNYVSILPLPFLEKANKSNLAIVRIDSPDIPIAIITKKNKPRSLPLQTFIQFFLDDILSQPQP